MQDSENLRKPKRAERMPHRKIVRQKHGMATVPDYCGSLEKIADRINEGKIGFSFE